MILIAAGAPTKLAVPVTVVLLTIALTLLPRALSQSPAWVAQNVHATTDSAAAAIRRRLIREIWGADQLPPLRVDSAFSDIPRGLLGLRDELPNLAAIDRLVSVVEHRAFDVYLLRSRRRSGRVALVADGHRSAARVSLDGPVVVIVREALGRGNDVLLLPMPSGSTAEHAALGEQRTSSFHPLRFFLEPAIRALNEYRARYPTERSVVATGISGGGWLTVFLGALDIRVTSSFPVAGSLPLALRDRSSDADVGDWEQRLPGLTWDGVHQLEYLDLYLMGASDGRTAVQINNEFDKCCFAGRRHLVYAAELTAINPRWRFALDRFPGHGVGDALQAEIAPAMGPRLDPPRP